MSETKSNPLPRWFRWVSVVFLLWNLFGLAVFVMMNTVYSSQEGLVKAGLNEEQVEITLATPAWVNLVFGMAVVAGVLGSIALLMRRKLAVPLFIVSLVAVLAQNTYMYLLSDTVKIMGVGASPVVIAGAIAFVPFSIYCAKNGWLK